MEVCVGEVVVCVGDGGVCVGDGGGVCREWLRCREMVEMCGGDGGGVWRDGGSVYVIGGGV